MDGWIVVDTAKTLNVVIDLCETVSVGGAVMADAVKTSIAVIDSPIVPLLDSIITLIATIDSCTANDTVWMSFILASLSVILTSAVAIYTSRASRKLAIDKMLEEERRSFDESCGKYLGIASTLSAALISSSKTGWDDHYTDDIVKELTANRLRILSHINTGREKICDLMDRLENKTHEMAKKHEEDKQDKTQEEWLAAMFEIRGQVNKIHHELQDELIEYMQKKRQKLVS